MISPSSDDSLCSDYVSKKKTTNVQESNHPLLHQEKKTSALKSKQTNILELLDVIQKFAPMSLAVFLWETLPHSTKGHKKRSQKSSQSHKTSTNRTPTPTINCDFSMIFWGFFGSLLSFYKWENTPSLVPTPLSLTPDVIG